MANDQPLPDSAADDPSATGPAAAEEAIERMAEARAYAEHLLAAEIARFKLRMRRMVLWAIAGVAAVLLLLTVLVTATALLLWGLASMIGQLLGVGDWLGALITGGGILLLAALGVWLGLWSWTAAAFARTRQSFAGRKELQRQTFGRDVDSPRPPVH